MKTKEKAVASIPDFTDFIGPDEAKELLGFKPETPNSNRRLNTLVRRGKIRAFQPSAKSRIYSRKSIFDYILSTQVPSDEEFVPVRIQ